jgi:cytochrome oxidase assembly protein ShyY1
VITRQKIGITLLAIFFALIFFRLGVWQLDKARLMQEISEPPQERPLVSLTAVAQPNKSVDPNDLHRIVTMRGRYIGNVIAPNQEDAQGKVGSWTVGILAVEGSGKIAVVRGVDSSNPQTSQDKVTVIGRLLPSQINNKYGEVRTGYLSRIDSALLLSEYGSDFFDGYVIARSEEPDAGFMKVPSPIPIVQVSGFYWQHVSYVVVWWLFALLALAAPFIRSKR